jgi:hypothetical protein
MTPLVWFLLAAQAAQNPSPMVEHARRHQRLEQVEIAGERPNLSLGRLLVGRHGGPLLVHFHGAAWLAEVSARRWRKDASVLAVEIGAGSSVYSRAFSDPARFGQLLDEAGGLFSPVVISGFSAGYGAVREILRNRENWQRIDAVVLADAMHASYVPEGKPGRVDPEGIAAFVEFAREAVAGRKGFVISHSEVFPGTYASTTECADALAEALGLRPRAVLKWGPLGMQQVSEVRSGRLRILGFAGNSAPDHTDHFHALGSLLRLVK